MTSTNKTETREVKVWDFPVRLFHWGLTVLIVLLVVTAKMGGNAMEWHAKFGYATLGLVLFRIVWGFIGSQHARFVSFVRGPGTVFTYLKDLVRGRALPSVGHNPMGGWSVVAMLLLIGTQVATGVFSNDDIMLEGPLAHLVSKDVSDQLTSIHHAVSTFLFATIGLHIVAIAFYLLVKKENLITAMIRGHKTVPVAAIAANQRRARVTKVRPTRSHDSFPATATFSNSSMSAG